MIDVESTNYATAHGKSKRWIRYRKDRAATPDMTWIFSDGGVSKKTKTCRFSAVIVHKGGGAIRRLTGSSRLTSTRNVGSELNGFLLGLEHAPRGEKVAFVFDYLGVGAWMTGNWQIKDPEVRVKIDKAHALVKERELDVTFIHHAGHQRDDSDFTRFNAAADALCSGRISPSSAEETDHGEGPAVAPLTPRSKRKPAQRGASS